MTTDQRFELAVLLEKLSLINGMLAQGTPLQKKQAKKEMHMLTKEASLFLTPGILHAAKCELA